MSEQSTDHPPKRRRPPAPGADTATPVTPQQEKPQSPGKPIGVLQRKLERFFVSMALPFAAAGDMHCAAVLATRGPIVAEAWASLAAESPAVRRVLESMLKGGAWAGALSSTVMLVVPIAAHHGAPIPDIVTATIMGSHGTTDTPGTEGGDNGNEPTAATAPVPSPGRSTDTPDPTDPANYPGNQPPTN